VTNARFRLLCLLMSANSVAWCYALYASLHSSLR
jgi:hypothetical protein